MNKVELYLVYLVILTKITMAVIFILPFPTFVDGRGGKSPVILTEGLTPEDSRLEPVTSPRTERVYARLTN